MITNRSRILLGLIVSSLLATHAISAEQQPAGSVSSTQTLNEPDLNKIKTIVVIYAENRSFDNLYGLFPGANGIANAMANPESYLQRDRDGKTVLTALPPVWNSTDPNWSFVAHLPNKPFQIDAAPGGTPGSTDASVASPDLVHRFYNHQMQINGGRNDLFAVYSDAGGLSMGYYDGAKMAMWQLAKQYTLADNFFMGAFGGSFLNHFWLVCACTPYMEIAPEGRTAILDDKTGLLRVESSSGLHSAPHYTGDFNFTPEDKTTQRSYAINTTQPPFQPSGTPPTKDGDPRLANQQAKGSAAVLSPQTEKTIGDTLSERHIEWAWYAGAWYEALLDGLQSPDKPRKVINNKAKGAANFQPHHQPFNYFSRFDPATSDGALQRAAHLKDYTDFQTDIVNGTLPAVVFYKPQGSLNQHPGYTDVMSGDAHIAEVVKQLQGSPQWPNMFIIVTYDENGGFWDHVAPPSSDRWGPGSRVPAIFISPFVKKQHVDHTVYDTTSIIQFITRRFNLHPLPGIRKNMGDLINTLE